MAEATSNKDMLSSMTSVKTEQDEEERPAVFNCQKAYLKLIDDHLCMTTLKDFKDRLDLLRKSYFYITILPKETFTGLRYVKPRLLLHPQRLKHMKEMGRDQAMMKLFLLEKYLEEIKKSRSELVEMVQSNKGEFSPTKQETLNQYLSGLGKLVNDFQNMSVRGPLHIKHKLILPILNAVHQLPSLRLFLNIKRPVMFDRLESTAFDNWARLSWHVSGQRHLTDNFDLRFRQINVPANQEAHSGVIIVEGNTLKIHMLLPEETYKFSIGRTKASNVVYDEWRDVLTLSTRASWAHPAPQPNAKGDYKTQCDSM